MSHLYRRDQIYWLAYYQNNKLKRESLKTKDKSAARYLQNKKDRDIMHSSSSAPSQANLCLPALEEYLTFRKHRATKQSTNKTEHEIRDFLTWGQINKFDQITEKKFQEYLNHKINKLKPPTVDRYIASVKAWLNYCVRTYAIFFNPLSNVKKYKSQETTRRFLTKEQIKDILDAAQDPSLYADKNPVLSPLVVTAIYTGLRKQELFNLEWEDIDFKRNMLTVRNREGFTTKSKKNRTVELHRKLKVILLKYRKKSGKCFDVTNYRRIFARIARKINVPDLKLHELRHTFASHLIMQGVDIATVAKLMGHSSVTTTEIYMHLTPDHLKNSVNRLNF